MKLGMFTACFPDLTLTEVASWAAAAGYQALEVASWPAGSDRPYTPCHLDVGSFDPEEVLGMFETRGLVLSSLAFYDNNLHPDPVMRLRVNEHLRACIDAAQKLGCPTVGTFVGRDPAKSVPENLRDAERIFAPLVEHAGEQGVSIVIENCVMEGWHPDGYPGNLAYSPELWEWMFSLGLFLNFDPSHLVWMGIDPIAVLRSYIGNVIHVQAKDIEVFPEARNRFGYPGRAVGRDNPWDSGWWRYRIPGLGEIDWRRVIDVLYEGGFDGVVSVEHEDPIWSGGDEKTKAGLELAYSTLSPLIIR
jgi:sugar phosphate isomerase/epimerase